MSSSKIMECLHVTVRKTSLTMLTHELPVGREANIPLFCNRVLILKAWQGNT